VYGFNSHGRVKRIPLLQWVSGNCWKYTVGVPVVGTRRKLRIVFQFVRVIKGYERNVGLIAEININVG
jgi:hypothetical protein